MLWVFTSDVHLYLSVGGTVVRRGERPLRRHLGEITMSSRGERLFENRPGGCMLVELQIRSAVVKVVRILYHGCCRPYNFFLISDIC